MDDSTCPAVLEAPGDELAGLLGWVAAAEGPDLAAAEGAVRERMPALGGRLLATGLTARGTGKAGPRVACPCGGEAAFEGYRPKRVQALAGWVGLRRPTTPAGAAAAWVARSTPPSAWRATATAPGCGGGGVARKCLGRRLVRLEVSFGRSGARPAGEGTGTMLMGSGGPLRPEHGPGAGGSCGW